MASETRSDAGQPPSSWLKSSQRRRDEALQGGGPERIAKIHESGRMTARERIEALIDRGSWFELGVFAEPEFRREGVITTGDGIITGMARVNGRKVCVIAVETTVLTGTTAPVNMRKQGRIAEWAGRTGLPLVCLWTTTAAGSRTCSGGASRAFRSTSRPSSSPRRAARRSRASPPSSARVSATRRSMRRWATSS